MSALEQKSRRERKIDRSRGGIYGIRRNQDKRNIRRARECKQRGVVLFGIKEVGKRLNHLLDAHLAVVQIAAREQCIEMILLAELLNRASGVDQRKSCVRTGAVCIVDQAVGNAQKRFICTELNADGAARRIFRNFVVRHDGALELFHRIYPFIIADIQYTTFSRANQTQRERTARLRAIRFVYFFFI